MPLQFPEGKERNSLKLTGAKTISIEGLSGDVQPGQILTMTVTYPDGSTKSCGLLLRIDTANETTCFKHGGIFIM